MDYEELKLAYDLATKICDPIEYQSRQKNLLYALADYLIERDMPESEKIIRDEEMKKSQKLQEFINENTDK